MNWEGDRPDRYFDPRFDYPGEGRGLPDGLCAQLLAYYDGESGMYIGVHDGEGHAKRLGPVWKRRDGIPDTIDLSPIHRIPESPGNDFFCSYDTVLGCFHGDWQTAAGIYKAWAKSQSWCRKKLREREDIPDWIKEGAFFFNFRLRYQQGGEIFLDTADQYVKAWANILDMPIVAMMCGWEKWGEWTGPDYFPPYGGDNRFRRMCARMKDAGIRPFPFGLSGFKLPVRKKLGKDWPQPELEIDYDNRKIFREQYEQYAAMDQNGLPIMDAEVESWDGLHGYACIGTPQAREQIYGASLRLIHDYGVQVSQADQVLDGGTQECYNPAHGHPLGKGKW